MSDSFIKVTLHNGKDHSLKRFHPWVFSGAIKKISLPPDYEGEDVKEGDVVEVYSAQDEFLGMGHYQIGSIAIRMFSYIPVNPDYLFWKEKLQKAYNFRTQLNLTNNAATNCYRLFFGEGDGLPGLVIDYYNGTAVFQSHSIGMHLIKPLLVDALREIYGDKLVAVYDKSEETMPKQAPVKAPNGYLWRKDESVTVQTIALENNHRFFVDWEGGQKTGFFLDQRENRELLGHYSKDKVVLNTFCYTGGFSVYAANEGAKEVHSIDISKKAIELTDRNIELNGIKNHQSFAMDTFEFLKHRENTYDIIVLDPPAFAKHQNVKHNAVMGYKRLNYEAIKQIKPGGLLFTFSCSQVVDKNTFNSTVMAAAIEAGRTVRVLHHLSQPPDHAVNIFHPEGEYLKGLVVHVE
ncbi:MAG: SAM-dependent methyltransferase [Bacteroidetes bacterium]|nr:SAM-dependent methyltransferase [Bacteroidota bacterium]